MHEISSSRGKTKVEFYDKVCYVEEPNSSVACDIRQTIKRDRGFDFWLSNMIGRL